MAGAPGRERRRFPRARVTGHALTVAGSNHVRLLDINSRAVLLACPPDMKAPAPGQRAVLRMVLGTVPFSSEIEVRRVEPMVVSGGAAVRRLAATFVNLTPANRLALEQFLGKAAL